MYLFVELFGVHVVTPMAASSEVSPPPSVLGCRPLPSPSRVVASTLFGLALVCNFHGEAPVCERVRKLRARLVGCSSQQRCTLGVIRGIIVARIKRNGMKGGQDDELTLSLVRNGDRWLIEDYTSKRNWHRALGR